MQRIRSLAVNHLWWVVLIIAISLLTVHSFAVRAVVVDHTSLLLLVIVLMSPFIPSIRKIKFGDFEAEIGPEEVRRVTLQVENSLPVVSSDQALVPEIRAAASAIRTLSETDPVVALAKLRIELESKLRRLLDRVNPDRPSTRFVALAQVIRNLTSAELFSPDFGAALRDVIAICNRAIHGEDIRDVDARRIIDTGIELLEAVDSMIREYGIAHPVETTEITPAESDSLQRSRYRLTTVVPFTEKPEKRVYILTQEELDSFLNDYSEFAEAVISVERLRENAP